MALLSIADNVSRVHASRRFFDILQEHNIDIPVIHQRIFSEGEYILACLLTSPFSSQMTLVDCFMKNLLSGNSL